jgi:hypothetical protein
MIAPVARVWNTSPERRIECRDPGLAHVPLGDIERRGRAIGLVHSIGAPGLLSLIGEQLVPIRRRGEHEQQVVRRRLSLRKRRPRVRGPDRNPENDLGPVDLGRDALRQLKRRLEVMIVRGADRQPSDATRAGPQPPIRWVKELARLGLRVRR